MYDTPRPARTARAARPRTTPSAAGWIALAIWAGLAILAFLGCVGVVAAFSRMTEGLPPVSDLGKITFSEQSIVYDRTGKVELARFGGERRTVVPFKDIPPIVIDAQTAVEDKTFWDNAGFDPLAIVAAGLDSLRGNSRGASTITQQLVRQRLLDPALVSDPHRTFERKVKEIIQSIRLTEAYPGQAGKQQIIADYLNENYYGNQAYGVKAAAKAYFGVDDLFKLTPAQAAILAGLPKSPSNYDLTKNDTTVCDPVNLAQDTQDTCASGKTKLVVDPTSAIVQRRNQILELLASGRTTISGNQYTPQQLRAAEQDEVVLAPQVTPPWVAPHFVWAVQQELADKLCNGEATCTALEQGGLTITTTLDVRLQAIAEKWVQAAAIVPNSKNPAALAKSLKLPYAAWMRNLRGKDVHNGAMVAVDYQTGELVAYVGSANYYATKATKQFQPKFDVVGSGFRQPGSAFKPFNYLTGIDDKKITAASMFMDTSTNFGGGYTPADADRLERGPVRVRNALQFSLNIPAVKAALVN
ncbi:MAG TPA: transglycosylase domain-containing protein, partial [Candidatus Limnocylindrales bacterium]